MAAILSTGWNSHGPISKIISYDQRHNRSKFHACTPKCQIFSHIAWTNKADQSICYCLLCSLTEVIVCDIQILTHWGLTTHICVGNLTITGSDYGLSAPSHHLSQFCNIVNWTNFNRILFEIREFWYRKINVKMSSVKSRLFCLGLNVLTLVVVSSGYTKITRLMPFLMVARRLVPPE